MSLTAPFMILVEFQHTAARRRLQTEIDSFYRQEKVSTHSRAKAAAADKFWADVAAFVSTHSRPKAAAKN